MTVFLETAQWLRKNIIFVLNFMSSLRYNPETNQDCRHHMEEFLILDQTGQMALIEPQGPQDPRQHFKISSINPVFFSK